MLSLFSNLYKFSLPRISRSERTVRPLFTRFPDAEILRAIFPSFGKTPRRVAPFVVVVVVYDVQTLFFATYRVLQVGFPFESESWVEKWVLTFMFSRALI